MKPYQGRRWVGKLPPERREHVKNNIAQALQQPAGAILGLVASLAPGPAGIALRAILGAFDNLAERKKLEEDRELRAKVLSLRKAVDALEVLAEQKADEPAPAIAAPAVETKQPDAAPEPEQAQAPLTPLDQLLQSLKR
jgi:hypothetical protein